MQIDTEYGELDIELWFNGMDFRLNVNMNLYVVLNSDSVINDLLVSARDKKDNNIVVDSHRDRMLIKADWRGDALVLNFVSEGRSYLVKLSPIGVAQLIEELNKYDPIHAANMREMLGYDLAQWESEKKWKRKKPKGKLHQFFGNMWKLK